MSDYDRYDAAVEMGFDLDVARQMARDIVPKSEDGALRVWWIRNMPNKATHYGVADLVEAMHLFGRLVWHDLQLDVESNIGGLEVFRNGEWEEWYNEEGLEYGGVWVEDFDQLFDAFTDALRGPEEEDNDE